MTNTRLPWFGNHGQTVVIDIFLSETMLLGETFVEIAKIAKSCWSNNVWDIKNFHKLFSLYLIKKK